jgi:uncharacterized membrane protein
MNFKKQSGLSMWGIMGLLVLLTANGLMALKIGPVYMDNMSVQKVLDSFEEPLKKGRISKSKIKHTITRKLLINNIRDLSEDKITIIQSSEKTKIEIKYEVRRNLFYNLDAVVKFDNVLEVRRH